MMARHNTHKTAVCTARLAFSSQIHMVPNLGRGLHKRHHRIQLREMPALSSILYHKMVNDLLYDACCSCFTFKKYYFLSRLLLSNSKQHPPHGTLQFPIGPS